MKILKLLFAITLLSLSARAQNPVSVRSTNGFATNLTANGSFAGNGGGLTNLNGTNLQAGTVSSNSFDAGTKSKLAGAVQTTDSRALNFSAVVTTGQIVDSGSLSFDGGNASSDGTGNLTATSFIGNGSALTGLPASGIATLNGLGTNTTITNGLYSGGALSNATIYRVIATGSNRQAALPGFTYTTTNGQPVMSTQAGGFAGMWPGYSLSFAAGVQLTIQSFVGGNGNGSGGNATGAVITPNNPGSSLTAATPLFYSPDIFVFLDDAGNFQSYIDAGGQGGFVASELQGFTLFDTPQNGGNGTNSLSWGFSADEDGNRCLQLNSAFGARNQGLLTIASKAPFNSLNIRGDGHITCYNGRIFSATGFQVGNETNNLCFTIVNTNWVSGQVYTNLTGRPVHVICPCQITMTGVAGAANFSLVSAGNTTNSLAQSTLITSLATSLTNCVQGYIPINGVFTFTNLSTGTGDSGGPVNGGQYMSF